MYALLYLIQYLLVGISLCFTLFGSPRLIRVSANTRILIGIASTPFVLALHTFLVAIAFPGAPALYFLISPIILSILILVVNKNNTLICLSHIYRRTIKLKEYKKIFTPYNVGLSICIVPVLYIAMINASHLIMGHDALIYFNEAKEFALNRTLESIPNFNAKPGEVVAGHPHTFIFQAYIAQALLAGDVFFVKGGDYVARYASQFSFILLFVAIAAVASLYRIKGAVAIAIATTLLITQFEYISVADSRDSFRITSFLLCVVSIAPLTYRRSIRYYEYLIPAIFCSFAIAAHTLNGVYLLFLWFALFMLVASKKMQLKNYLLLSLFAAIACFVPLSHYFNNYLLTGNLMGYGMYYILYKDTPLWDAFQMTRFWNAGSGTTFSAFNIIFERYGYFISILGLLSSVSVLCFRRLFSAPRFYPFLALLFIASLILPISGILDVGLVGLKRAYISNVRYPLATYSLVGLVVIPFIMFIFKRKDLIFYKIKLKYFFNISIVVISIFISSHILDGWRIRKNSEKYVYQNMYQLNNYIESNLSNNENWIVDRYDIAYYSKKTPLFLYSKLGRNLFATNIDSEIWSYIKNWNVKVISLRRNDQSWWPKTRFYQILNNSDNVMKSKIGLWDVYTIHENN